MHFNEELIFSELADWGGEEVNSGSGTEMSLYLRLRRKLETGRVPIPTEPSDREFLDPLKSECCCLPVIIITLSSLLN